MCVCRGCTRPGRRTVWQWLRRRPRHEAPRSHAQAILGVAHGRIHDLRVTEAEAGMSHSTEVIHHFDLPPSRWQETPDEARDWHRWDHPESTGCFADPHMVALELR